MVNTEKVMDVASEAKSKIARSGATKQPLGLTLLMGSGDCFGALPLATTLNMSV